VKPPGHVRNFEEEEAGIPSLVECVKRTMGARDVFVDLKTREVFVMPAEGDILVRYMLHPDLDLAHPMPGDVIELLAPGAERAE
jgi:hypothetical protein